MAFQQQQQRYGITAETGDERHEFQHCANPRKRKIPVTGQSVNVPHCCTSGGTAWETEIHQIEKEAYTSVLRAFKIQADSISWEKESLITNLRQELQLSNDEHREILGKINTENGNEGIRELRQTCSDQYGVIPASSMSYHVVPRNIGTCPRHKQSKRHSAVPHQSFDLSSAYQQSSLTEGRKLHKVKNHGNVVRGLTNPIKYPSSGPNEMGSIALNASSNFFTNKTSELAKHNYLLGQKVKTRLPHDHNFYDAVISRYDPARGLHALSFNFASGDENLQWVDLTKIPPGDIQWDNDDPEMTTRPHCFTLSGTNTSLAPKSYNASAGRGVRMRKSRLKSEFLKVSSGSGHDTLEIKIRMTDDLLETVKRVFSAGNVDPYTISDAKEVLKEHEKALIQVLESLADVSDDE